MSKEEDSLEDLKYILGNMGIEILFAIDKGARDIETIKLFSGIPISCIKGRIPVLLDLNLIKKNNEEFFLEEKGKIFKKKLEKENQ
jgi:predicted transcriptional regulator